LYHPKSTFKGIVRGENTRILRNCTKEKDYLETMQFMKQQFANRKFHPSHLNIPLIAHEDWSKSFNSKETKYKNCIPFTCKYNREINIKEVLNENLPTLASDEQTRKKLLSKPLRVSYKHSKKLSQRLVWAKLDHEIHTDISILPPPSIEKPNFAARNIPCRNQQCGTCKQLTDRSHYYSFQTKIHYQISDIYSCDTIGAIYPRSNID